MINFFNEDVLMPNLSIDRITNWIDFVVSSESGISGDINFIFCSDKYLLDMNNKYLNHDYFTDVITFDYTDNNIISGDVFISIDRIKDNAKQLSILFDIELNRIMVHGVLHLLGYKDKLDSEKEQMTILENKYLEGLNN